ncbi:MAG: polysaccharide biosynthesis tyrosine autokinase [Spirochaetia bacterium]|nr:polysaccharide biosynthesis tyrosine autokinase [Spirochaetia bacterium]
MDQQTYQENQNEISLKDILRIIRKRKFWLLATFIIVVGLVAGYLFRATPIYQASATLWVEPTQSSSSLEDIFSLQGGTNTTRISTEVELIKSRRNIEKVIEDLDLMDYYTRLSGSKNSVNLNSLITSISNMISVSTVKDTNIVRIAVENENPNLARNLANTLSVVYNDMLKELAQESYTVRREFIESQIGTTEQLVLDAENLLREFKEEKGIYLLDEEARLLLENVTYYEKQIDPYTLQIKEAESKIKAFTEILTSNGKKPVLYEKVSLDPVLRSIRAEMAGAKLELAGYQSTQNPVLGIETSRKDELYTRKVRLENELKQQILEIVFENEEKLSSYIRLVLMELADAYSLKYLAEIDVSYLTQLRNRYEEKMITLPALEQQLLDHQRDVTVKQNLYILLLENFEEAKIAEAAVTGTSTIIDQAVTPVNPIKPNKKMMLAIGVLLGLFLGVLLVFLVEAFDDAIRDEESIRRTLGPDLPILGRIPHLLFDENQRYPELIVYNDPTAPPSEAYKLISTNILYSTVESPKVISITSAEMAQGKTSIIANAGIAMAQNGLSTLLIDADMRKPRLEKAMGLIRSQKGLVNHLLQDVALDDLIQTPLEELPNLKLLAVGPLPPNPTALLTSEKFLKMMKFLRTKYDKILIDLPPLLAASDALIAARLSDGIVMVVRSAQSSKYGLKLAAENIGNSGIPVVGIVINDITREDSYHYYHYYYYYSDSGEKVTDKKRRYKSQYKKSTRKYRKKMSEVFGKKRKRVKRRVSTGAAEDLIGYENQVVIQTEPEAAASEPEQKTKTKTKTNTIENQPVSEIIPDEIIPAADKAEVNDEVEGQDEADSIEELQEPAVEVPDLQEEKVQTEKSTVKRPKEKSPKEKSPKVKSPKEKSPKVKSPFDYITELEQDVLQEEDEKKGGDTKE